MKSLKLNELFPMNFYHNKILYYEYLQVQKLTEEHDSSEIYL